MTISSILFLHFIFLGLFNGCFSSNPETILIEDYIPEDNEERTDEMQMEDLSPDSDIVMVQSQEDNNERTGKVQKGDLSSNPKSVTIQSQEEIKMQKMQIIKMQMEDPFINPESAMIQSQVGNNEKIGRMQMEDASNNAPREIYIGGVRSYSPYSGWNQRGVPREPNYERTDRIENVTPFPTAWTNSRYPQPNSRPPNKVNRNSNNNRGNSRPINSPPVTTEEFFDDKNPENVVTKSPGRCRNDPNFFASLVNTFAFELVETLNLESNFVISPLSIFVALSMCYLGSSGKTKAQIEQAFGMTDCQLAEEDIHQGIKNLLPLVLRETPGYELFVANGLFLGKDFRANAQFEEDVKRYYDAELKNLDFGNPDSLKFINDWVTKNTRNMITSIISRPPNSLTRLILLNAVFFKGIWKMQFPPSKTYNGNFHTLDRNEKPAQFMRLLDETFPVFRSDKHKHTFIKLPYAGDEVSMIIALPYIKGQKPMPKISDSILYYDVREGMVNTELGTLAIPKFRLEYKTSLKRPLQILGIIDVFDPTLANLTKLRKENDLYLSKIMHKAVVEVNEVGTTASAVTSDFVGLVYKNKTNFVADHPFAFYIVHEATGLVLFYGKLFDFDSEASEPNVQNGNAPSRSRPTEPSVSNDRSENERFKPRPGGASDANNRREPDRFRPGPAEASDSSNRGENGRLNPRPTGTSDSNNRREPDRLRPEPAEAIDSNNHGENGRFNPRPTGASDSNNRRDNESLGPGPAEASDSNNRGENRRFNPRPTGASDSNNRRDNERLEPRPTEARGSYDRTENERSKPRATEAVVADERSGTLFTSPRPIDITDSNDRRESLRPNRYKPAEASNSNGQRGNSNTRYRPSEELDSNDPRNNPRSRNRPAEAEIDAGRRNPRPPQRLVGGSDMEY